MPPTRIERRTRRASRQPTRSSGRTAIVVAFRDTQMPPIAVIAAASIHGDYRRPTHPSRGDARQRLGPRERRCQEAAPRASDSASARRKPSSSGAIRSPVRRAWVGPPRATIGDTRPSEHGRAVVRRQLLLGRHRAVRSHDPMIRVPLDARRPDNAASTGQRPQVYQLPPPTSPGRRSLSENWDAVNAGMTRCTPCARSLTPGDAMRVPRGAAWACSSASRCHVNIRGRHVHACVTCGPYRSPASASPQPSARPPLPSRSSPSTRRRRSRNLDRCCWRERQQRSLPPSHETLAAAPPPAAIARQPRLPGSRRAVIVTGAKQIDVASAIAQLNSRPAPVHQPSIDNAQTTPPQICAGRRHFMHAERR